MIAKKQLKRSACILGAAPDSGNLGVSALLFSALHGLAEHGFSQVSVFDNGVGSRAFPLMADAAVTCVGLRNTRKVHLPESMFRLRVAARLPRFGSAAARTIADADVALGISGGDSFTDLYGRRRFRTIAMPMEAAIQLGTPLVLLPQTYGPFSDPGMRRDASRIVRAASLCFARDERSLDALVDLLGDAYDPAKHRLAVDMAFALPRYGSDEPALDRRPVGINVSGLILDPNAREVFGLRVDYRALMIRFLREFLTRTQEQVVLVPHVTPSNGVECDLAASQYILQELGEVAEGRVRIAGPFDDPRKAKAEIARTSWFLGTRMHAAIGALSSGVPAAALAYSMKTQGVFDSVGVGSHVADMTAEDEHRIISTLWRSYRARHRARTRIAERLPSFQATLADVFQRIHTSTLPELTLAGAR